VPCNVIYYTFLNSDPFQSRCAAFILKIISIKLDAVEQKVQKLVDIFQPALNSQLLPPHVAAQAASASAVSADEAGGESASPGGAAAPSSAGAAKSGQDESMNQGSPSAGAS
jgi:hypothetical protein